MSHKIIILQVTKSHQCDSSEMKHTAEQQETQTSVSHFPKKNQDFWENILWNVETTEEHLQGVH